jgi:hypothetical protein
MTIPTYQEFYQNILADIQLVTSPMEAIIPGEDETAETQVARDTPEYEAIQKRVTAKDLFEYVPPEHPMHVALKDDPSKLEQIVDEAYVNYNIFKYLEIIGHNRTKMFTNGLPMVSYCIENIDLSTIKSYLSSRRIRLEKAEKHFNDMFFGPDMEMAANWFALGHQTMDTFDVMHLFKSMCSNIVIKSDNYVIVGMYLILLLCSMDMQSQKSDDAMYTKYVEDVLSMVFPGQMFDEDESEEEETEPIEETRTAIETKSTIHIVSDRGPVLVEKNEE